MDHFPDAKFSFREFTRPDGTITDIMEYPDKTASVHCTVEIGEVSRSMWLPVMDHRNRAITDPDAREISDNKMRALVKCIALYGLGHYLYSGEDLPSEEKTGDKDSSGETGGNGNAAGGDATLLVFQEFCSGCETLNELKGFWNENTDGLKKIEEEDPEGYKKIISVFSEKKAKLLKEE